MTRSAPTPCVCGSTGKEQCRDCAAWLCAAHNPGGTWSPRCDHCYESSCRRHARWAFPMFAVFTLMLVVFDGYVFRDSENLPPLKAFILSYYAVLTIFYWTHWTGRAFRKKPPRAVARFRPRR